MKRKGYSVEQIVAAVKRHELGTSAADISRKLGIVEQTFYRWKKQYGGLEVREVSELKQLRDENAKLKKLVADLSLDKAMLQDITSKKMSSAPQHREAVRYHLGVTKENFTGNTDWGYSGGMVFVRASF